MQQTYKLYKLFKKNLVLIKVDVDYILENVDLL